jgi:hypothetical protein
METEVEFLNDVNALISQTLEEQLDPWDALKALASEIRNRIDNLEAEES